MKKATIALLRIGAPILALSLMLTFASAIWLGVLGEWRLILMGLLVMGFGALPLSLACLPSMLFAVLTMVNEEKGRTVLSRFLGFMALLFTSLAIGAWVAAVLWFCTRVSSAANELPLLFWGLGVAISPWAVMARSEISSGGNEFSLVSILFLQMSYFGGIAIQLLGGSYLLSACAAIGVMVINAVVQAFLVVKEEPLVWGCE